MNILITGTSRGLGAALASYLCSAGHHVVGIARSQASDELSKLANYNHFCFDIAQDDFEPLAKFLDSHNSYDQVWLNAGVLGEITSISAQTQSEIDKVMNINVWSNKRLLDLLLSKNLLKDQIVAISSGAAKNGNKGWGAYSISKASLNMLIKLYAAENDNLRFITIAPGLIDTTMQDYLCSEDRDLVSFPSLKRLQSARNTENMPQPEELAPKLYDFSQKMITKFPSGEFLDIRDF